MLLLFIFLCLFASYHKTFCPPAEAVRPIEERVFEEESKKQDIEKRLPVEQIPLSEIAALGGQKAIIDEPTTLVPVSSLPEKTGVTLQQRVAVEPSAKESGAIAVKSTPAEKPTPEVIPTKEQSLTDWQKSWSAFKAQAGVLWGSAGELYKLPVEQRAQAILNFVDKVPSGFFSSPQEGLKGLADVVEVAKATLVGDPNAQANLEKINDKIASQAVQIVRNGNFGKTTAEALENLSYSTFSNSLPRAFDINIPEVIASLHKAALEKSIILVQDAPVSSAESLIALAGKLNQDMQNRPEWAKSAKLVEQANNVIANKIAEVLLKQPLSTSLAVKTLAKIYLDFKKKLPESANQAIVNSAFDTRLKEIVRLSGDPIDVANKLQATMKNSLKQLSTEDQMSMVRTIGSLLAQGGENPSWISQPLTPKDIENKYRREQAVLGDYLKLVQSSIFHGYLKDSNAPLTQEFKQSAERAMLIEEFLQQREVKSAVGAAIEKLDQQREGQTEKDPYNLAQIDKGFWQTYKTIQEQGLFKNPDMYALPKDLAFEGSQYIEELTRTKDPAKRADLLVKLYKLRDALSNIYLGERMPKVAQFVERVNGLDIESFNKLDLIESNVQKSIDTIATFDAKKLLEDLQGVDKTEHTKKRIEEIQEYIATGQVLKDLISNFTAVVDSQATAEEADKSYAKLTDAVGAIIKNIDYREIADFPARLNRMTQQQQALVALDKILKIPLVAVKDKVYTLQELNDYYTSIRENNLQVPSEDILNALEEAGFITRQQTEGGVASIRLTERGAALSIMAQEADAVTRRIAQLNEYVAKNGQSKAPPVWEMGRVTNPDEQRAQLLVKTLRLPELILDDQLTELRNLYKASLVDIDRKILAEAQYGEKYFDTVRQMPLFAEKLKAINDVLEIINKRNNGQSVDRALEIFISYKLLHPGETPNLEELLQLEAVNDEKIALSLNTPRLRESLKSLGVEVKARVSDAVTSISQDLKKQKINVQQKTGLLGRISSFVAAIWTYFTTKTAINSSVGGLVTLVMPGLSSLSEAVSIGAGALAGIALWKLAEAVEPTTAEIEALNEVLVAYGKDPIKMQGSWLENAQKWAKEFVETDYQNMLNILSDQKKIIVSREGSFNSAREKLYSILNLPKTASFEELAQAIKQLDAKANPIEQAANYLKKQRAQSQLEIVVSLAKNLAQDYQTEITTLSNVALQAISQSTRANTSQLANFASKAKGLSENIVNELKNIISTLLSPAKAQELEKRPPADEEPTRLTQVYNALNELTGRQQTDLQTLIDLVDSAKSQLDEASSLEPGVAAQLIKDILTGRIASLRAEYTTSLSDLIRLKEESEKHA